VFGDQRSIFISRGRATGFDRGGQPPVQLGAIRFELCFVGHRPNQRMVKHIFRLSGEGDLVDEFAAHQVLQDGLNAQRFEQARVEP